MTGHAEFLGLAARPAYGPRPRTAIGTASMSGFRHNSSSRRHACAGAGAARAFNLATQPKETTMKTERPDTNVQANAELDRSFEPLRIVFALSALLLGLIATLRF